jgi:hypothetical protein
VQDQTARKPLLRTVDLDRGESQLVELADGSRARVKLLDVEEERDGVRSAIRQARVRGYPTTQNFRNLLLSQEILRISRQQDMPSCVRPTRLI